MDRKAQAGAWHAVVLAAVFASTMLAPAVAGASPSNKWRIEVSGGADSDGSIVITLAPVGQEPVTISVDVPKGTGENRVAKQIRDAFRAKVDEHYKSEVDDGEDVLVKKRRGNPDFELTLASNSVQGVRLDFEKE
jgi:hypothetical protein